MSPYSLMEQGLHNAARAMAHARNRLLVRVHEAAAAPDERFQALFGLLVAEVEAAFRQEETLMETAGFGGLPAQRRDNALLLAALHRAQPQVEGGNLGLGRETVAALGDLLSLHRFSSLRMLATAQRGVRAPRHARMAGAWPR